MPEFTIPELYPDGYVSPLRREARKLWRAVDAVESKLAEEQGTRHWTYERRLALAAEAVNATLNAYAGEDRDA